MPVLIAVTAVGHPTRDSWVDEQAHAEATYSGVELGEYLGREDVLPNCSPDICCHLFAVVGHPGIGVAD